MPSESPSDARAPGTPPAHVQDPKPRLRRRTLSKDDWEMWRPIFKYVRDHFGAYIGKTQAEIEASLENKKQYDTYSHYVCTFSCRGTRCVSVRFCYESTGAEPRLFILAVVYSMESGPMVATRTTILHDRQSRCGPWIRLSMLECDVVPCCEYLCLDVPEDCELSQYENKLHIAKKQREMRELHVDMEAQIKKLKNTAKETKMAFHAEKAMLREMLEKANKKLAKAQPKLIDSKGSAKKTVKDTFSTRKRGTADNDEETKEEPESEKQIFSVFETDEEGVHRSKIRRLSGQGDADD